MKITKKLQKLSCLFLLAIFTFALFTGFFPEKPVFAEEGTKVIKIETSNVLDDLEGSTIDGKPFELKNFPEDTSQETTILNFAEVGFSKYKDNQQDYSLYVYVYNPALKNYKLESSLNTIQFKINDSAYGKYKLKYVNDSSEKLGSPLYIKFKVDLSDTQKTALFSQVTTNSRKYYVSGIELLEVGAHNAHDCVVGRYFLYSGYGDGYGAEDDALTCVSDKMETISLNVEDAYWRSKTSDMGKWYQNQVNTVYFSVPNRYLEMYGKLQQIKAEWYEYKTKDIVVTSDERACEAIKPFIGKTVKRYDCDRGFISKDYKSETHDQGIVSPAWASWNYNCWDGRGRVTGTRVDALYYLFKVDNIENYDPYAEETSIGGVSSNELYKYMLDYNKSYKTGTVKDGMISADLFENDIDSYRKIDNKYGKVQKGYSYYEFDADTDIFDINDWNPEDKTFRENSKMYGFLDALFGKTPSNGQNYKDVQPIKMLEEKDMSLPNWQVSDNLLISFNQVDDLKDRYNEAKKNDETVFLFRFASTDYYAEDIDVYCNDWLQGRYSDLAYRAWQSVFFDFDIIQLTFSLNGAKTVIPVVADPIDIVPPATPSFSFDSITAWIWIALAIVLVCTLGIVIVRLYKRG